MPSTSTPTTRRSKASATPDHEVVIIGAGFGGIGAAVELKKAGIDGFIIIDKATDVGGTWNANTYPGVAVDIPSVYYSFSYEPPQKWTRFFSPGSEVKAYADQVVDTYGLRPHLRLGSSVVSTVWDETNEWWRATLDDGQVITSRYAIGAVGGLEVPNLPDIDGLDGFSGKVVHTARWDHEYDYTGKRIAVIGTGATALQLIPQLAQVAERLDVYQRTAIWVAPRPDFSLEHGAKRVLDTVPGLRRTVRSLVVGAIDTSLTGIGVFHARVPFLVRGFNEVLKAWYRTQIPDPVLREKLTPQYAIGCKRPSVSNTYLKTFLRDNVELVTDPINKITPDSVVTDDGVEREVDVVVCATGFKVMEHGSTPPFPVLGRGGKDLNEWWHENRYQAYQGVSIPGYPNFFMITGPYGFAAGSYLAMIECTSRHAARAIAEARRRQVTSVEVTQEAHDTYYEKCLSRAAKTMWFSPVCDGSNSYYINYQGDAAALRPSTHAEMWWQNKHFPHSHYHYGAKPSCESAA